MNENKIRALRTKKKLTQSQLAKRVGTSQQQIHRIETGAQSVRFDLAIKICAALETKLEIVFPKSKRARREWEAKNKSIEDIYVDEELKTKMEEAHIDMDPRIWIFKYELRGGAKGALVISGIDKKRLFRLIQMRDNLSPFVIFDSEERRVALNLNHLLFCHFLYEPPNVNMEKEEELSGLRIILSTHKSPYLFDIDPDEDSGPDEEDEGQLKDLLYDIESSVEENDVLGFEDADGEMALFRAMDVALIEVPLWAIHPEPLEEEI